MPKIRVGIVKGGKGFAAKKFKAPRPVPAKFKGERVAPVNHDAPGGTSKPSKPTLPKPSSPVARRSTNAAELIAHVRKEQGASTRPKRKTRYK